MLISIKSENPEMLKLAAERKLYLTRLAAMFSIMWIVWFSCLNFCSAFPGGGPDVACKTMLPSGHGSEPQQTLPPYEIVPTKTAYKPGETISLVIKAKEGFFTGIYVQAHLASCVNNDSQLPIGTFTSLNREFQTRHCYNIVHSTLTQTNARMKIKEIIFWTAPVLPAGHVIIKATFVKSTNTYWTNVYSPILFDLQTVASSHKECDGDNNLQQNGTTLISSPAVTPEMPSVQSVITKTYTNLSLEPHHENTAIKTAKDSKLNITVISVFLVMWALKIIQ